MGSKCCRQNWGNHRNRHNLVVGDSLLGSLGGGIVGHNRVVGNHSQAAEGSVVVDHNLDSVVAVDLDTKPDGLDTVEHPHWVVVDCWGTMTVGEGHAVAVGHQMQGREDLKTQHSNQHLYFDQHSNRLVFGNFDLIQLGEVHFVAS